MKNEELNKKVKEVEEHEHWCLECAYMWHNDNSDYEACPKCHTFPDVVDWEEGDDQ